MGAMVKLDRQAAGKPVDRWQAGWPVASRLTGGSGSSPSMRDCRGKRVAMRFKFRENDRGREDRLTRPPLPPNRACGSPAHGSPVGGSPQCGLARPPPGASHGKRPENSEEDARSARPPSLGSPSCQHTRRTHRGFRPAPQTCRSLGFPSCLARRADTRAGLLSRDKPFTRPPSCGPSLHRNYPASSLLWPL